MNIVMVSLDFPPTVGGISAHVFELSKAMLNHGHSISVITRWLPDVHSGPYEDQGLTVYPVKLRWMAPLYGWQLNRAIRKITTANTPDIIHLHGMAPLEGYTIDHIPLVYTNHTSGYLKRIKKGGLRRMALLKRLFKKPDLFLAPSKELLEIPFTIRGAKHFIPNGVDDTKYCFSESDRSTLRKQLGFADEDLVGILTRRLVDKNGVIHLARATRHINNPHLKLLLIGDGPERSSIEETLNQHFGNRFVMLGAKQHHEIIPYYSAADFSILPSLMEATSISGLEAMSVGLPLVGTRVGGIPELILNNSNGLLCNPSDGKDLADKIDALLEQDLASLGKESNRMVQQRFTWSQVALQTLNTYKTIL